MSRNSCSAWLSSQLLSWVASGGKEAKYLLIDAADFTQKQNHKIIWCRTFLIFDPYKKWSKNVLELVHCKFIVVAGYKNLIWNPNLWKENIDRKWKPRKVLASSFDFEVLTSSDFQPILSQKYEKHVTQNVWIMDIEWSSKSVSKKEKNTIVKSSQHSAVFG